MSSSKPNGPNLQAQMANILILKPIKLLPQNSITMFFSLSFLPNPTFAIVRTKHYNPCLASKKIQIKAMKAVVQRVTSASVQVEGRIVSEIGPGMVVFVGIHDSDTDSDADYICRKVLNMRLYPNESTGKVWDRNVMQMNYEVLLVSQFTLYGILKGNKPDFHVAMPPLRAKAFYASVVDKFQKSYKLEAIKDGVFGAMMKVSLVNDGPVTMQLDSSQPSRNANNAAQES